jgi:hypothetical protein
MFGASSGNVNARPGVQMARLSDAEVGALPDSVSVLFAGLLLLVLRGFYLRVMQDSQLISLVCLQVTRPRGPADFFVFTDAAKKSWYVLPLSMSCCAEVLYVPNRLLTSLPSSRYIVVTTGEPIVSRFPK